MKSFKIDSIKISLGGVPKVGMNFGPGLNIIGAHSQVGKSLIFRSILLSMGDKNLIDKMTSNEDFSKTELSQGIEIITTLKLDEKTFKNSIKISNAQPVFITEHNEKKYYDDDAYDFLLNNLYFDLFRTPALIGRQEYVSEPEISDYLMPLFIGQKNIQQDFLWKTVSPLGSRKTKYALIVQSARNKLNEFINLVQENKREVVIGTQSSSIKKTKDLLFPTKPNSGNDEQTDSEDLINSLKSEKDSLLAEKRKINKAKRFNNNIRTLVAELEEDISDPELISLKESLKKIVEMKKAKLFHGLSNMDFNRAGAIDSRLYEINEELNPLISASQKDAFLYDYMGKAISDKFDDVRIKYQKVNTGFDKIRNNLGNELSKTHKDDELKILERLSASKVDVSNINNIFGRYKSSFEIGVNKSGLEKCLITNVAFITIIKLISQSIMMPYVIDSPIETNVSENKETIDVTDVFLSVAKEYEETKTQVIIFTGANDISEDVKQMPNTDIFEITGEKNSLLKNAVITKIKK